MSVDTSYHYLFKGNHTEAIPESYVCLSLEATTKGLVSGFSASRLISVGPGVGFPQVSEAADTEGPECVGREAVLEPSDFVRGEANKFMTDVRGTEGRAVWVEILCSSPTGRGGCGDRPVSAPGVVTHCLTAHGEEGLEVSEAGFGDDGLGAPVFLPCFHWAARIPGSRSCPRPDAGFSLGPSWATPAGSALPPSSIASGRGKTLASDLG